jgi:inhibitor of nuclear factor kappa-B kinase subunit alpha
MLVTFLGPFSGALWKKKKHGYFMQDSATAHTATYSIDVLSEVFEDRLISRRLWPARSPDLNPCDFYLWGNLKDSVFK